MENINKELGQIKSFNEEVVKEVENAQMEKDKDYEEVVFLKNNLDNMNYLLDDLYLSVNNLHIENQNLSYGELSDPDTIKIKKDKIRNILDDFNLKITQVKNTIKEISIRIETKEAILKEKIKIQSEQN